MYNSFLSGAERRKSAFSGDHKKPPLFGGGIKETIDGLLPFGLDSGDLLLLLVLLFLYTESGDEEFLILLIVLGYQILFKRQE